MDLPLTNEEYKNKEYWDERYKTEDKFDWFAAYAAFRDLVLNFIKKDAKILMLGCGNSTLSEEMYADGYKNIVSTDYSEVVIKNMAEKCQHIPDLKWEVMDMKDLRYPDAEFDVVLEKGTIDALLVAERDPWRMSDPSLAMLDTICSEVRLDSRTCGEDYLYHETGCLKRPEFILIGGRLGQICRVLKPDGCFVSITFAQPHFRKPIYAQAKYDWGVETLTFGEGFHYFFYMMTRGATLSEKDIELTQKYFERLKTPVQRVIRRLSSTDSDDEDFLLNNVDLDDSL